MKFIIRIGVFALLASLNFLPQVFASRSTQAFVPGQMCPMSDRAAKEKYNYEYQGQTYYFCCKMCLRDFKKNPEKHVKEWKTKGAELHPHEHADSH